MRQSDAWATQLHAQAVNCRADLAREQGVSRARVTQVLLLQALCPEVRAYVASADALRRRAPSEVVLRRWSRMTAKQQLRALEAFVQRQPRGV